MISHIPQDKGIIIINNNINNSNIKEKTRYQNLIKRYFSPNFSRVNIMIKLNFLR